MIKLQNSHLMNRMMITCDVCKGFGKLELPLAADNFREDDCDMCDGKGKLSTAKFTTRRTYNERPSKTELD